MSRTGRCARIGLRLMRIVPASFAWWLGGMLGHTFACLPGREQARCREHLARAFPGRDPAWVARTARRTFRHFGRMTLWTLATLHRDPRQLRHGIAVEGADNLRAAIRASNRGEPTVAISGHFGNWELLARVGGSILPVTVIGRRLRDPDLDELVKEMRTGCGNRLVYQESGVRPCLRELRDGRYLATLPDQDVPRLAGTFVSWFGLPAYTPIGPASLAVLSDCVVQPVFIYERAGRWVSHWGPRRRFPRSADRDADAQAIMAWAMAYEEALVRETPWQWVWWHKRWRTRPST